MKTLLQGKPYTPACATDIRKTFRRVRAEQKAAEAAAAAEVAKGMQKIAQLPRKVASK